MGLRNFASYHPWTIGFYFLIIGMYTMMVNDPINMMIASLGSHMLFACCSDTKTFLHHVGYSIIILLIIAVTNPLFVHQGVTILFYMNYNPITLEAVLYGFAFGSMITSILTLCRVLHTVMSTDKILYLFGSMIPTLGLIFSMILQLIPKFQRQMKQIIQTQRLLGNDIKIGSIGKRIRIASMAFSMMVTWAFEHGVMCADSMKARGYGLKRRTYFAFYRLEKRDVLMLICFILTVIVLLGGFMTQFSHVYYYPHVTSIPSNFIALLAYGGYGCLFMLPILLEGREQLLWRYVHAKI